MNLAFLLWVASLMPQPSADRVCLATTVYLEARGQSAVGQMAVAEGALRRRESGQWGNDLCTVLSARGQFALSTTPKSTIINNADSWKAAWLVAGITMDIWSLPPQWRMSIVPKADHFFAANSEVPNWAKGNPLMRIGDHNFYRAD